MKKALIMTIAMLAILSVSMVPQAFSFCIPPNPAIDDSKFEVFGPHINGIRIFVYSSVATEFTQMDVGQVDLVDWPLDSSHAASWATPNGPITEQNYGGENGYYLLDINNNATMTPDDAVTGTYNPTSDLALRQAIAACVNRSDVVSFTGGFALPMYTMVPPYMGGYINTQIAPGQPLEALTYGGYTGDLALANAILDAAGYVWNVGHTVRIDPHTGLALNLIFYSRGGDRGLFGDHLNVALNAVGIGTEYHSNVPRSEVTGPVFAQEYFNLYTGGWTGIGPDPDYLDDLYGGKNYYHPGSPPNYCNVNFDETNANGTTIKLAPSLAVGLAATLDFQYWFAYYAASVPVFSYTGVKAYKNVPKETSTSMDPVTNPEGNWKHLVNQKAVGVNSWWSTLDMQTYGNLYPNLNVWYGFSSTVTLQNVVYAQWYWDWEVLNRIYDGGWGRNPYTLLWGIPQLYKSYTVGTWSDPSAGGAIKTSVTVTLRPDAYWQDGMPITIADVYYTLVEMSDALLAKGFPPPWWYPTVQYMRSVEIIDDYNIQVLLDVQSVWAAGWVIGSVIIPKHIWKPIVDASFNVEGQQYVQGTTPDPNIIGSGPFRWVSGTGITVGDTIVMAANTPNSLVRGITSPGYYQYDPVYASITPPGQLSKVNILSSASSASIDVALTLGNMWTDGDLTVNKYVYVYNSTGGGYPGSGIGGLMPGFPINKNLAPVTPYPMGTSDVETLSLTLPKKTLWFIKLAVHIKGPATVTYTEPWDEEEVTYTIPNPWVSHWINVTLPIWVTIKEDIAGTDLFTVLGKTVPNYMKLEAPAPDLKVDGKDIALAALSFGTVPGDSRWNTVADVSKDFKVDGKDIALIALKFGY
jgi:ABC-type transport system substrate-binding protein